MMKNLVLLLFVFVFAGGFCQSSTVKPGWPEIHAETKPWTRWWWHGSAVTKEGITAELTSFQQVGLGGVEITPIYGVYGQEDKFVKYLSPEWMELFQHVLHECERLGLGVDMATGTGWPFGGPWISAEDACKNIHHKVYDLKGGVALREKIEFIQQPLLRTTGSLIYEVNDLQHKVMKRDVAAFDAKTIGMQSIADPIEKNEHLQAFAFEQVQFSKSLPLQLLAAYNESGEMVDLTSRVDRQGYLQWDAPPGTWKLYALFEGWHGKMVERAAPGGEGNVIDHFSDKGLQHYLEYFDKAFRGHNISGLRSFFNDSYEVDDATGVADWTPKLFDEFSSRRGYDLRHHIPALLGYDKEDNNARVLSDYRETIAELLRDNFTTQWKAWATKHDALVRNQAHGSPANILDLYGIVDIPEIEGTEPLRIKMASSAGNVMDKRLISAESATWLDEHFMSGLHQIKDALDQLMLNGVNHLFYHGTAYSPAEDPWPGWLFYAAVHLNSRNPQWKDFGTLNNYVARCQSFLQQTKSDNDILLYYPIYDSYAKRGSEMIEHFDGMGKQFEGSAFAQAAGKFHQRGWMFDYISDRQIRNMVVEKGNMITQGKNSYRVLVIPSCKFMPVGTLEKIETLIRAGANVVFIDDLPASFSGFAHPESSGKEWRQLDESIRSQISSNNSRAVVTNLENIEYAFVHEKIFRETTIDLQLPCIRKKQSDGSRLYFVHNKKNESFDGWITLETADHPVIVYDPMTGNYGKGATRKTANDRCEVYLQMHAKQSLVLQFLKNDPQVASIEYVDRGNAMPVKGPWNISVLSGGPQLPAPVQRDTLASWSAWTEAYRNFSGTCSYRVSFIRPIVNAPQYLLDLGDVRESASVFLNGKHVGTLIGPAYQIAISKDALRPVNELEIQVSNLMANRIAYMDRNKIFWKKFYNVNFPARKAENRVNNIFDASHWPSQPSGLIGPVVLIPLQRKNIAP